MNPLDVGPMPEVVQGYLTWAGGLVGIAGTIAGYVTLFNMRRKKAMAGVSAAPAAPAPPNPFGAPPPTDPMLRARLDVVESRLLGWELTELRKEVAEVRARDADAQRTSAALAASQLKLDAANARIATLEAAMAKEVAARAQAEADLIRLQTSDTARTPMLPKATR